MSMVNPAILDTQAYKLIEEDFLKEISVGPEYKCEICISWNYKQSVSRLKNKYGKEIFQKCYKGDLKMMNEKDLWICHTCDKYLKKDKMPSKHKQTTYTLTQSMMN